MNAKMSALAMQTKKVAAAKHVEIAKEVSDKTLVVPAEATGYKFAYRLDSEAHNNEISDTIVNVLDDNVNFLCTQLLPDPETSEAIDSHQVRRKIFFRYPTLAVQYLCLSRFLASTSRNYLIIMIMFFLKMVAPENMFWVNLSFMK